MCEFIPDEPRFMDVVQIDDDRRIGIQWDLSNNESPAEWLGDACSVVDYSKDNNSCDISHNVPDSLDLESIQEHNGTDRAVAYAIARHFTRMGWHAICTLIDPDRSSWHECVIAVEDPGYGTPEMLRDEINTWASGEIYQFTAQRRHEWADNDGYTLVTWDDTDVLSGIYASEKGIQADAREYVDQMSFDPLDVTANRL